MVFMHDDKGVTKDAKNDHDKGTTSFHYFHYEKHAP